MDAFFSLEMNEQRLQTPTQYKCSRNLSWKDGIYCFSTSNPTTLSNDDSLKLHLKQRDENQMKVLSGTVASLHLDLSEQIDQQKGFYELEGWFHLHVDEKKLKSNNFSTIHHLVALN